MAPNMDNHDKESGSERQPLLSTTSLAFRTLSHSYAMFSVRHVPSLELPQGSFFYTTSGITIQKHLTLGMAIVIMVGSVAGSAIFIAPTAVVRGAGSVGASLLIWATCGLLNLLLALCYAELGSAIPVAGGDYAYIHNVIGRFPAFMNLWVMIVLIGPTTLAFITRSFGIYYSSMFGTSEWDALLVTAAAICLLTAVTALNVYSMVLASKCATLLSLGKVLGMGMIIVLGIVKICQGHTSNFNNIFAGTSSNVADVVVAFLPAFYSCVGWDCINALAEEMKNPRRDLPIAAFASLIIVMVIYLAMNVAFFSMLSPQELVLSDTVGTSFVQKAWPSAPWIIPVLVCFSSAGSALNNMMACPRWAFAGGRDGNLPRILSFMHIRHFTPAPAVVLICFLAMFYTTATFLDLQNLLIISSLQVQIKTSITLIALLKLRLQHPEIPRTIRVPLLLIIFALLSLIFMIVVSVYNKPLLNGISILIFLMGAPIYYISSKFRKFKTVDTFMGYTDNFIHPFEGTNPNPAEIVVAFLPGFVSYGGWDCINALAEEMKNPRRDMPIAAFVSLITVIIIYLCINVAYFAMLSPKEFLLSDAVATSFIQKAWPSAPWIIPVLVCLSSAGSAVNSMMSCPRWAFAGGRDGNFPRILSFMHIRHFTPVPAVLLLSMISAFFISATFLDLQSLLKVSSLQVQIKTSLALIALIRLRHKFPETQRTIEVPMVFILLGLVCLLTIISIAVYQEPALNGVSLLFFCCGAPMYLLSLWLQKFTFINTVMDKMTAFLQRLMLVVPEKKVH